MPPSSGQIRKENSKIAREVQVDILQYLDSSDQFAACEKLKTHCCGWQRCGYLLQEHAVQAGYSSLCVETAPDQISLQFPCFYACVCSRKTKPYTFHQIYFITYLCMCMSMCGYVPVLVGVPRDPKRESGSLELQL